MWLRLFRAFFLFILKFVGRMPTLLILPFQGEKQVKLSDFGEFDIDKTVETGRLYGDKYNWYAANKKNFPPNVTFFTTFRYIHSHNELIYTITNYEMRMWKYLIWQGDWYNLTIFQFCHLTVWLLIFPICQTVYII